MLGPANTKSFWASALLRKAFMQILQQGGGSRPGNSGEFVSSGLGCEGQSRCGVEAFRESDKDPCDSNS